MGIRRWLEATRALTVRRPSVGGQSMTMYSNSPFTASRRSLRRKCASSSPTSLASSLARLMRAGARNRWGCGVGTMMSFRPQFGSTKASKTFFVSVRGFDEGQRAVALRVEVDEQGGLAAKGQGGSQVDGRGRLADAALLVRDRDDHRRRDCKHRRRSRQGDLGNLRIQACSAAVLDGSGRRFPLHLVLAHVVRDRGSPATSGAVRSRLPTPPARPAWPAR